MNHKFQKTYKIKEVSEVTGIFPVRFTQQLIDERSTVGSVAFGKRKWRKECSFNRIWPSENLNYGEIYEIFIGQ